MNIFSMTRQSLIVAALILSTAVAYSQQVEQDSVKTADTKKAEGEEAKDEKEGLRERQRKQWTKYYTQQIKKYTFNFESDDKSSLKLSPDSKLHYLNSVRGLETHGEMFIWTENGKCVLAGSILSYDFGTGQRRVAHEFHSFSEKKITGGRNKFPVELPKHGVTFKEITGAPKVSKSRALRMVQLRQLAKSFEASTLAAKGVDRPLRALNQPIFRYDTKDIEDDGAVFAYVTGTDPELLVAIETRQTKDGPKWHFAAARFTDLPITLKYKKQSVWEFNEQSSYEGGYSCTHGIDFQPSMPEVEEEPSNSKSKNSARANK